MVRGKEKVQRDTTNEGARVTRQATDPYNIKPDASRQN
jgi:hypothetical protein